MLIEILRRLFSRDLNKLKTEIESYKNENAIWSIEKGITNSAGNLCLHLVGNLNTYIGRELGGTNYVRDRDLEFSATGVSVSELIKKVEETIIVVDSAFEKITDEQLKSEYPVQVFESKTSTEYMLIHLATHLSYHLGQINYHRRLLDE